MATTVRKGVFETNSSSTHSLSFEPNSPEDFEIRESEVCKNYSCWCKRKSLNV